MPKSDEDNQVCSNCVVSSVRQLNMTGSMDIVYIQHECKKCGERWWAEGAYTLTNERVH